MAQSELREVPGGDNGDNDARTVLGIEGVLAETFGPLDAFARLMQGRTEDSEPDINSFDVGYVVEALHGHGYTEALRRFSKMLAPVKTPV